MLNCTEADDSCLMSAHMLLWKGRKEATSQINKFIDGLRAYTQLSGKEMCLQNLKLSIYAAGLFLLFYAVKHMRANYAANMVP